MYGHFAGWPKTVTIITRWLYYWGGRKWGFTVVPFIFMVQLCYPSAGCKENHFYSLLFGQAEASITVAQTSFQLAPETFWLAELISQFFCYSNSLKKNVTCSLGKLKTEFSSPTAKSTSPGPGYRTLLSLHAAPVTRHYCSKPNSHKFWP